MRLEEKLISDDRKWEISKSDEDLAFLGMKPGTGIIIQTTTGIDCQDRIFVPFDLIQEFQSMLDYVQEHWGTGKPR